jgi:hypothetical protein
MALTFEDVKRRAGQLYSVGLGNAQAREILRPDRSINPPENLQDDLLSNTFDVVVGGKNVGTQGFDFTKFIEGEKLSTSRDAADKSVIDRLEDVDEISDLDGAFRLVNTSFTGGVDQVETKPVESMPDMPDSQNTSMVPDLDLKTGGLVLAAGVLGLALLRGDS